MKAEIDRLKKTNNSLRYKLELLNEKLSKELHSLETNPAPALQRMPADTEQLQVWHKKVKSYE